MDRYSFRAQHVHGCEESLDAIVVIPEDVDVSTSSFSGISSISSPSFDDQQSRDKLSPVSVMQNEQAYGGTVTPEKKKMKNKVLHGLSKAVSERVLKTAFQQAFALKSESKGALSSPGSVEKVPGRRFNSVVVMETDGCEVELEYTESSPSFRRTEKTETISPLKKQLHSMLVSDVTTDLNKNRQSLPKKSLIDSPAPTPSPQQQYFPRSLVSDLCCGPGTMTCWNKGDETVVVSHHQAIQNTISVFLASHVASEDWCSGWQAWTYFETDQRNEHPTKLKEGVKQVLRNRAFDMNAKTARIQKLKEDLCPFDVTPDKKHLRAQKMTKTRSFSAADRPSRQETLSAISMLTVREEPTVVHSVTSMWDSVQGCTELSPAVDSPFVIRTRGLHDDDVCYDSDPEETTRRRSRLDDKRRRKSTFMKQGALDDSLPQVKPPPVSVHSLAGFQEDTASRILVQELLNERFTLIWHPCPTDTKQNPNNSPIGIKAWIERGQQLRRTLIQPKLCWQQVSLSDPKGILRDKTKKLHNVDLLDITRVLEVTKIDRRQYPLAPVKKCLLIHTLDQKMMFEAGSEAERNRLVHTLKLTVARLGSKIIIEDPAVFDEFFSTGNGVPGEAPVWAKA